MTYTKEKEGDSYGKEKNENMEENIKYNFDYNNIAIINNII